MKKLVLLFFAATIATIAMAQQSEETKRMQERFLSYVSIESQSVYLTDPDTFPITEGQRL